MWFLCAILTFTFWGLADLFYKLGNKEEDHLSHYKTGIMVGIVMGIHATGYLILKQPSINFIDLISYLPVSLCYIISMIIGYKGLKYLELSISSPIQNSSGIITSLLLVIIFKQTLTDMEWFSIFLIGVGVFLLSLLEQKGVKRNKLGLFALLFPILYALLDGAGTFLDGIYLDQASLVSEDVALISYEYTFFIYAIITFLILKIKKVNITLKQEKEKLIASIFETCGQFFYVYAMATESILAAPIVAAYSVLSIILSRIFLKEKLERHKYITILLIILGIIILGFCE